VDVFASAAQKDMDEADKQGFIISTTRTDIAANSVVLIVPVGSKTSLKSFEGLVATDIKKIAIGNPKTVPAGRYAEEVFNYYKLLPAIKHRFIFTENVRQVLDYIARDEVDAGVVYATDAATRPKETKIVATAPEASLSLWSREPRARLWQRPLSHWLCLLKARGYFRSMGLRL
jgi:molybdate transport system substrate-binding protein